MLDDSDISSTRHARAFICGVMAELVGQAEIYVSGGAEHQSPDGAALSQSSPGTLKFARVATNSRLSKVS